jgi:hypothetical protein
MTELSTVNGRSKLRWIILLIMLTMGFGIFFLFRSCTSETSPLSANVVLKKDGQNYLFSPLGSFVVKDALAKGGSPQIFNTFLVYQDDSEFFLVPSTIESIAAIANGEYELHAFKELNIAGYVTTKNEKSYAMSTKFKTAAKLGEQDMVNTIILKNSKGAELTIEWTLNSKRPEYSKLKNCEMHSFMIETSPAPGQVVYSSTEYLVVPLKTLATFFDRKMSYDIETNLLVIEE